MSQSPFTSTTVNSVWCRYTIWFHPFACFLISLAVYSFTMPRTITLEDAGLFQLVCHLGGISHPPGYPLHTLLCGPFVKLTNFTNTVLAGNLLSALFACTAVGVFHHISYMLLGRRFAWVASMAYAFSATFWSQSIIIEVYSLAVLMFLLCVWIALEYERRGDIRYWYALGFFFGLALSNHWPLMILSTPALLFVVAGRFQSLRTELSRLEFWLLSLLSLLLGLSPYMLLVFNSEPMIAIFGGIHSADQFFAYITRSVYPDGSDVADILDKLNFSSWIVQRSLSQQGIWAMPLILAGIVVSIRSMTLIFNLALLFTYLGSTFLLLALLNFDFNVFNRATFSPFPIIAYLAIAMWFSFGVMGLVNFLEKRQPTNGWLKFIPLVCVFLILISNYGRNNRRDVSYTQHYAATVLESLPRDSTLFVRGDFESGLFGYLNLVQGVRPDIEIREWNNLVFSNRLAEPLAARKIRDEKAQQFINSTRRPVFSITERFEPATDYGLYHRYNPGGENNSEVTEELDDLVSYFIRLYREGLLSNSHEKILNYQLLVSVSRTYAKTFQHKNKGWKLAQVQLNNLRLTFPGKFVMLETAVEAGQLEVDEVDRLLSVAREAESSIPDEIDRKGLGLFYEYYARLYSMQPDSTGATVLVFEKSIQTYPSKINPSICRLRDFIAEKRLEPSQVLKRFNMSSCQATTSV